MTTTWYWRRGRETFGPVSREELQALWTEQRVTAADEVREGTGPWRSAASLAKRHAKASKAAPAATTGKKPRTARILGSRLTFVAVLTALAAVVLKGSIAFEPSYEEMFKTYQDIFLQADALAKKNATDSEWNAFEQDAQQRIPPIVEDMQKLCEQHPIFGRSAFGGVAHNLKTEHIRMPLLQLGGKNGIPGYIKMARAGQPRKSENTAIMWALFQLRQALDAIRLDSMETN